MRLLFPHAHYHLSPLCLAVFSSSLFFRATARSRSHARAGSWHERVPDEGPQLIATGSDGSGSDAATTRPTLGKTTTLGRAGLSPIVCRKRSWLCGPSLLAWDFLACFFAACFFILPFLQEWKVGIEACFGRVLVGLEEFLVQPVVPQVLRAAFSRSCVPAPKVETSLLLVVATQRSPWSGPCADIDQVSRLHAR